MEHNLQPAGASHPFCIPPLVPPRCRPRSGSRTQSCSCTSARCRRSGRSCCGGSTRSRQAGQAQRGGKCPRYSGLPSPLLLASCTCLVSMPCSSTAFKCMLPTTGQPRATHRGGGTAGQRCGRGHQRGGSGSRRSSQGGHCVHHTAALSRLDAWWPEPPARIGAGSQSSGSMCFPSLAQTCL